MNWIIIVVFFVLLYFLIFKVAHVKQKLTLILVILFLLFFYVTYVNVTGHLDLDYKSVASIEKGIKVYFSWLGTAFSNFKGITGHVVKMDWGLNKSVDKPTIQEESWGQNKMKLKNITHAFACSTSIFLRFCRLKSADSFVVEDNSR